MVVALIGAGTVRALLVLDRLPGVGPAKVRRLVARFGSAERALAAPFRAFAEVAGSEAARARTSPRIAGEVDGALERARALGMHVTTWASDDYPGVLRQLADPPPVLFLRGRRELLEAPSTITVVGARRATGRARDVAERIGTALAREGHVVASGLALGVDGCAHAGALRAGGATLAVLGTGADIAYPRTHARLFRRILREGLVVSEFLPGAPAQPHHFPRRNRILAALASDIVVVEAGRKSGSLITVDHALDLGRDVWAVPGPIDSSTCAGSNRLLVEGARPLVSIDGLAEALRGRVGTAGPVDPSSTPAPRSAAAIETEVLEALRDDVLGIDEIASRFRLPTPQTLAILTTLELHGEIVRLPGMRFRRAA